MFENNWTEVESNIIEISGHSYEGYYEFLRYIYTDFIESEDIKILIDFLSITDEYLEEEMKEKCIQKMLTLINSQNVSTLYSASILYKSKDLQKHCFEFMSNRMNEIKETDGYKQIDSNELRHLFNKYILYINAEN